MYFFEEGTSFEQLLFQKNFLGAGISWNESLFSDKSV